MSAEDNGSRRAIRHSDGGFAVWVTSEDDGRPVSVMLTPDDARPSELPSLPAGVSHLLAANDALMQGRWGVHITLCGLAVRRPGAPVAEHECELGCGCVRYCPECVGEAARWSADAGDPAATVP